MWLLFSRQYRHFLGPPNVAWFSVEHQAKDRMSSISLRKRDTVCRHGHPEKVADAAKIQAKDMIANDAAQLLHEQTTGGACTAGLMPFLCACIQGLSVPAFIMACAMRSTCFAKGVPEYPGQTGLHGPMTSLRDAACLIMLESGSPGEAFMQSVHACRKRTTCSSLWSVWQPCVPTYCWSRNQSQGPRRTHSCAKASPWC